MARPPQGMLGIAAAAALTLPFFSAQGRSLVPPLFFLLSTPVSAQVLGLGATAYSTPSAKGYSDFG